MRRRLVRAVQRLVRRGRRKVLWTQPTANLGNFLYDWQHAWIHQQRGEDIVCLRTPATEPWLPIFGPAAYALVVARSDVRLTDRREIDLYNEYGIKFTREELNGFIEGFLAPTGVIDLDRVPAAQRLDPSDVLLNVRRGDYYSNDQYRRQYAFDLDEYLTAAIDAATAQSPIGRIQVVSDGIDWCEANLGWLRAHCRELTFVREALPPAVHFAMLANADRLILTNSTFSYWGGYISTWRTGRPAQVIAPWFHIRPELAAWQLDPEWTIIRHIPSNWDLPDEAL